MQHHPRALLEHLGYGFHECNCFSAIYFGIEAEALSFVLQTAGSAHLTSSQPGACLRM